MAKVQSASDNTELRLNETSVDLVLSFYILLTLKRAAHSLNRLTALIRNTETTRVVYSLEKIQQ